MAKPKKSAESGMEHRRRIAAHPETREVFALANVEPHVKSLRVTEFGLRMEFQALHPRHAKALLECFNALRGPVPSEFMVEETVGRGA